MNVDTHVIPEAVIATAVVVLGLVQVLGHGGWAAVAATTHDAATAGLTWIGGSVTTPLWLIGLLWALAVTSIGVGLSLWWKARRKCELPVARPTTALIFGIRWRWNYRDGQICDLLSFCPKCDLQVVPKTEARHGFLNLISFSCACRKWKCRSFHCSQANFVERVCRSIEQDVHKGRRGVGTAQHA
jgi:hypothetical protein